jgi:formylglycine-generating enzyme required for sulfatase activity
MKDAPESFSAGSAETADDPFAETGQLDELDRLMGELASAPSREPQLRPGATIGRFNLLHVIGRGGFGVVYEALDTELGRHVAVKVMRTRGEANQELSLAIESVFEREATTAALLNHPNIVTLHDYGTVEGSPYLILELLGGETLESRIQRGPLRVEEAVPLMIQVAQGLRHAHGMGVMHRDLKPLNVFLTTDGQVKILDFGLARLRGAVAPAGAPPDASLTDSRTRHLVGTPAYMAPEQWRGEALDERTDIYAVGLMLFEMLVGQLPWPAADPRVAALADQPVPRVGGVPDALGDLIASAVAKNRNARLASAAEFLDGLVAVKRSIDSARSRRRARLVRRAIIAAAPLLVGAGWAAVTVTDCIDRSSRIGAYVEEGDRAIAEARNQERTVDELRRRAFEEFDALELSAEATWQSAREKGATLDRLWARAEQILARAMVLDGNQAEVRSRLGEVLLARASMAERDHRPEKRDELVERLGIYGDAASQARWRAPASLSIETEPTGATVIVQRYGAEDPRRLTPVATLSPTPIDDLGLAAGSYLLLVSLPGRQAVRYPVVLGRGEVLEISIPIPRQVPKGFAYVPPGRFLHGCGDETIRENFHAQPEHALTTAPYLIARHEVTFGDWIDYLEDLPATERPDRTPRIDIEARDGVDANSGGSDLELRRLDGGDWQLRLRGYQAREGEPFVYRERSHRSSQRWERFPVMGVSFEDGEAYTAWLDRTGRVRGARLCSDLEWERAARGADARTFPHGDRLAPDDANIDVTYRQRKRAFGPDEVGSHPASDSPFGVADLAGNVWEWTQSALPPSQAWKLLAGNVWDWGQLAGPPARSWERGGSWYQSALTARTYNREYLEPTFHTSLLGLRVCATVSGD